MADDEFVKILLAELDKAEKVLEGLKLELHLNKRKALRLENHLNAIKEVYKAHKEAR